MNNKKTYKFLLLVIVVLILIGTQSFAATLSKVTGLRSNVTSTGVDLSWNKLANATGYEVYIRTLGSVYKCVGRTTRTTATLNGLEIGETYYAKIRGYRTVSGTTTYGEYSSEIIFRTSQSNVAQVTNLRTTNVTSTGVNLSWNSVAGATGYEVYVNIPGIGYVYVRDVNTTTAEVTGFTAGETYYAKVRAFKTVNGNKIYGAYSNELRFVTTNSNTGNGSGAGSGSNAGSTTVGTVTNLRTTDIAQTTVNLAWNSVANASGYEIWYREAGTAYRNIGAIQRTSVQIQNLKDGVTYYMKVRAYKIVNGTTIYGNYSNELNFTTKTTGNATTLGKITDLAFSGLTQTEVRLTWSRVSNATGYEVWLRTSNSSYQNIGNVNDGNVRIINLQPGTTYYIKVRAYRTVNGATTYGSYSNEITFTTIGNSSSPVTVDKVTNLKVNNTTDTSADLTWDRVANATGYEVYIYVSGTGYKLLGTTTNTNITATKLTAGTSYSVKVRAYRTVNGATTYGTYSDETRFITSKVSLDETETVIEKVKNLKVDSTTSNSATISWDTVSKAEMYDVYVKMPGSSTFIKLGSTFRNYVTVSGLRNGMKYEFKIVARGTINGREEIGEYSEPISVTVQKSVSSQLGKATNLQIAELTKNSVTITWNNVDNATNYEVYIKEPGSSTFRSLGKVSKNRAKISGLQTGVTYEFKIMAVGTINGSTQYGDFSDALSVTAK